MVSLFLGLSYCWGLLNWGWPASLAQTRPAEAATVNQPLALPADSSRLVVLTTGKLKPMLSYELSPGGSYAIKITPPVGGQYTLASIGLHLQPFGRHTAQGQLRLRVVAVAADGSPADDNPLLPPRIIPTQTLQALNQPPLTLTWPSTSLRVPAGGFFVVLEGVGDAPDEYVISSPRLVLAGKGYYQVGRRSQPDAVPRQLSTWSIPSILGAKRINPAVEFWMRGGDLPTWRAFPESKTVPLLDVSLE